MGYRFAPECNHTVKHKCPCISENEVNFIKYIDETGRPRPERFMEHFPSKQISPLAAILLPQATKQTGKVNAYKQSYFYLYFGFI